MKVDMSPEAVTARLREMDELCELSWKLMNAKKVKGPENKISPDNMDPGEGKEDEGSLVHEAFPRGK